MRQASLEQNFVGLFFVTFGVNIRKYPLYCLVLKMSVNKPSLPRREAVGGELVTKDIVSGCRR